MVESTHFNLALSLGRSSPTLIFQRDLSEPDIPKNVALSTLDVRLDEQEVISIIGALGEMWFRGDVAKCNTNSVLLENSTFSFSLYCPNYTGFFVTNFAQR